MILLQFVLQRNWKLKCRRIQASFPMSTCKSYSVEKIVLHHLKFLLIKISKSSFIGSKRNFIPHAFAIQKPYICSCDKTAFGTNTHLLILICKISDDAKLFFLHDKTCGHRKQSLYTPAF